MYWPIVAVIAITSHLFALPQLPTDARNAPLVEFRETNSDAQGESGYILTIDSSSQATVRKPPAGPDSKTLHIRLTCEEQAELPDIFKREMPPLQSSYGSNTAQKKGEISVVSRWSGPEKRVVWRNPPSKPEPPGGWYAIRSFMEQIERRAEEEAQAPPQKNSIVYWRSSSGYVGTYIHRLEIDGSGQAVLRGGLHGVGRAVSTQLTGEELTAILHTFSDADFLDFKQCYGRNAVVNPQNRGIDFAWDGKHNEVKWMSAPADPQPPEGWTKITAILDKLWARLDEPRRGD